MPQGVRAFIFLFSSLTFRLLHSIILPLIFVLLLGGKPITIFHNKNFNSMKKRVTLTDKYNSLLLELKRKVDFELSQLRYWSYQYQNETDSQKQIQALRIIRADFRAFTTAAHCYFVIALEMAVVDMFKTPEYQEAEKIAYQ